MVTKIYKIRPDYSNSTVRPVGTTLGGPDSFRLKPMRTKWPQPVFYIRDPARTTLGDFVNIIPGAFGFRKNVLASDIGEIIEASGEILEGALESPKEPLYVLNVLASYNCLNREKSICETTADGSIVVQVKKYEFHVDRIEDSSIFKIPETCSNEIYAVSRSDPPEDEFYATYHRLKFTGLKFEFVWEGQAAR